MQRKKTAIDKRESLMASSRTGDESHKKVRGTYRRAAVSIRLVLTPLPMTEKSSWMSLSRSPVGSGHWRSVTCRLLEEGDKCLLHIYLDVSVICTIFKGHKFKYRLSKPSCTKRFTFIYWIKPTFDTRIAPCFYAKMDSEFIVWRVYHSSPQFFGWTLLRI